MELTIPLILCLTALWAAVRGVNIYDALCSGAAEGIALMGRMLPALVCLLPAAAMFRQSGALEAFTALLSPLLRLLGMPEETVLSEKQIMLTELPSRLYGNIDRNAEHSGEGRSFERLGIEEIDGMSGEQGTAGLLNSMTQNSPLAGIGEAVRTEGEALLERVLFLKLKLLKQLIKLHL